MQFWKIEDLNDFFTSVKGCISGFGDLLNCREFDRKTSARSPYGMYSKTIHGLLLPSRSTAPFNDKIFLCPKVDMMSTSRIKSSSASRGAVSFKTFIATISFESPIHNSPAKKKKLFLSITSFYYTDLFHK